ncbi:helix-turn-helix domain-containing protein [Maricaulis sp.]|uniref:helix-turn-helix domain-containing protein n=1 Tax=Maricaulis sp. TaxID=1486257 RepID=UPI001B02095D|nr:helix-turn-helix transcriptional regulator [Maricaulis sp.]MBO6764737.1 helix-turn-helix transcriptional regulator [Maricaulis sp.]
MSVLDETDTGPISSLLGQLGLRMEAYRISRQLKQEELADRAGISARTLRRLEADGNGTLDTFARLLRALDLDHRLLDIIPDATVSPLDTRSTAQAPRQRVRHRAEEPDTPWTWGDETDET